MSINAAAALQRELQGLDGAQAAYASHFVEALLQAAVRVAASDVHLQPTADRLEVRWRLDGVLHFVGAYSRGESTDIVARLKVLAGLLTYRTELPQEGRLDFAGAVEMRVSTLPTTYGERAVVRIFATKGSYQQLQDLALPSHVERHLGRLLEETSGAVIVCGPAGSGKTTTIYACLRHVVRSTSGGKSVITLEDPIEADLPGVAQSQVNAAADYSLAVGLRALMRQDPEVLMVGEIRDRETAEATIGASLTGHLVLTTFHSQDAVGGVSRLLEMGIEPYLLRSGVLALLGQRLLRRLCDCATMSPQPQRLLGLPTRQTREPAGCLHCLNTGYQGRLLLAEVLDVQTEAFGPAILERRERSALQEAALASGLNPLWRQSCEAVESGGVTAAEVRRVFGFSDGFVGYGH